MSTPLATVEEIGAAAGGYAIEVDNAIYIPVIWMATQGQGEGGRFLDALPIDRTIKVPAVLSTVLAGMLERRGFTVEHEWAEHFQEWVEVYVRRAAA